MLMVNKLQLGEINVLFVQEICSNYINVYVHMK